MSSTVQKMNVIRLTDAELEVIQILIDNEMAEYNLDRSTAGRFFYQLLDKLSKKISKQRTQ